MIVLGPALVIVGVGFFCWLLFTLAVFALPFFAGLTIGIWAFHTGAGVLGGIAVGLVAGGVTFGLGQQWIEMVEGFAQIGVRVEKQFQSVFMSLVGRRHVFSL